MLVEAVIKTEGGIPADLAAAATSCGAAQQLGFCDDKDYTNTKVACTYVWVAWLRSSSGFGGTQPSILGCSSTACCLTVTHVSGMIAADVVCRSLVNVGIIMV